MLNETAETLAFSTIDSVELQLRRAGVGARSYAFIVDWHIRAVAALLLLLGLEMLPRLLKFAPSHRFQVLAPLPGLLIYLCYHPVLEILQGGLTPGKRMAGIRIVANDGGVPGSGALLVRNLFRLVDMLPALYALGLLLMLVGKRQARIGDLASGTSVVVDPALARKHLDVDALLADQRASPELILLAEELLRRWPELQPARRAELARTLLQRAGRAANGDEALLQAHLKLLTGATQ